MVALLDFVCEVVERLEDRYGRIVAWLFALILAVVAPILAIVAGFWWYLG
ncbi:hypothetical protein [Sphingomonas suaedae]|nr:hypothetical protein [Sphingomonas suaedae]